MSVGREEVERIARLAALAVDEATMARLTVQIGEILDYVSQLDTVESGPGQEVRPYPGPRQPLRPDEPRRTELAIPLSAIAPAFEDGLFLVPRLGAVGASGAGEHE